MFSPKEPEIKLRYVSFKEEKRERLDSFSPFVRVRRQPSSPSLCTVVNYPEEGVAPRRGSAPQQRQGGGAYLSGAVPSSSCLQLGRVSSLGAQQRPLVCCLCGQAANAMDLGDLHGPYYPEGFLPGSKAPAGGAGGRGGGADSSDSDSSSYSVRKRRGKKRAALPPRPCRAPPQDQEGEGQQWWVGGANGTDAPGSPASKRSRMEAGWADGEDWYSAPVLPLEACEFWLHEDCGIWSAGVFLVRGRVYGLEEAVKVAQETVRRSTPPSWLWLS